MGTKRGTPPTTAGGRANRVMVFAVAVFLVLVCGGAGGAEGDLSLNMVVNYGSAYRDGAWIPIDVLVDNERRDVKGWVELRTYGPGGEVQNPIYRAPADSPKNSRKRFRFHCLLEETSRIEAQLLHGRRGSLDVPTFLNVTPIRQEDFLCLVLDDKPENFGFLSTSLFSGSGDVRFYRESLDTPRLAYLADHPQCYDTLDLIVMGEVDASRVGLEHRDLLKRYVEKGGVLVVCAGANAKYYRGSWVEEFAGVTLGQEMVYKENELAARVFGEPALVSAAEERQTLVTRLSPVDESVKKVGADPVLATLRRYGNGYVAVIALDAASGALQRSAGYAGVWGDLIARSKRWPRLNYPPAAKLCANELPLVAGVELLPVSSVITYLVVYFLVAIVGNWLFWNHFKRREYAWLCLIGFSIAFTGYAMIFGTAGRAKVSEMEEVEVLCVPQPHEAGSELSGEPIECNLHAFAGLLAAGSGRYGGTLADDQSLVSGHMSETYYGGARYRRSGMFDTRPFLFVQDRPARVEEFQVGASEMRILQVDRRVKVAGGVRGTLTLDAGGVLSGRLENETGLNIKDASVLIDGQPFELQPRDGGWDVATQRGQRGSMSVPEVLQNWRQRQQYTPYPAQPTGPAEQRFAGFKQRFQLEVVGRRDQNTGALVFNEELPPCLVGWVNGKGPFGSFTPDEQVKTNISGILVVAKVEVERSGPGGEGTVEDLSLKVGGRSMLDRWCRPRWRPDSPPEVLAQAPPGVLWENDPAPLLVRVDSLARPDTVSAIRVELLYATQEAPAADLVRQVFGRQAYGLMSADTGRNRTLHVELRDPGSTNAGAWTPVSSSFVQMDNVQLHHDVYLLENVESLLRREGNAVADLVLTVEKENEAESPFSPRRAGSFRRPQPFVRLKNRGGMPRPPGPAAASGANPSAGQVSGAQTIFVVRATAILEDTEEGVSLWR